MKLLLELSNESHPSMVLHVGDFPSVPAVGDYVDYEAAWRGYVKRRRWTVVEDHSAVVIRCWLHSEPPQ